MKYFLFTVYDADYEDIMLYLYNEAIDKTTDLKKLHKKATMLIAKDLRRKKKDPKKYKANRKLITYKELKMNYMNRATFIEPDDYTDYGDKKQNSPMHYNKMKLNTDGLYDINY